MKKNLLLFICICITQTIWGQGTQNLRGRVLDAASKYPLVGAQVVVYNDTVQLGGAISDAEGYYKIENITVGRRKVISSFIGYKDMTFDNIIINSGKESSLDIGLEESVIQVEKAVIVSATKFGEVRNEMATVSSKAFSIEETDRYAGSRGDPARMASSFAGVQGADDSRNDIVVRGNSPSGVLWRVEGIDIFNPNHFNIPGTTGGSITILNNKWLSNSDFFTGAFPAEYGNTVSGVFDLRLRNGNNEKYEFSGQLGLLGTELMAEGPLSKKGKASFLVSYRYSTLSVLGNFGIKLGTSAIPRYQDASFRLNFPLKNNQNISVFAIGGISDIDILISNQKKPSTETDLYGQNDRDQYFHSRTGMAGATYSKAFNANTYTKVTLMYAGEQQAAEHNLIFRRIDAGTGNYVYDSMPKLLRYDFRQSKASVAWTLNHKINKQFSLKGGLNTDVFFFDFHDTIRTTDRPTNPNYNQFAVRWNASTTAYLMQPYIQFKYQPIDKLTFNAGLHAQYFSLGNALSAVEPRVGVKYELPNAQQITFGAGLHSQMQNTYLYFYKNKLRTNGDQTEYNRNRGFTKAAHFVLGYQKLVGKRTLLKLETYYQSLFEVPIDKNRASSFSLVNTGSGFSRFFADELTNKGTGENYGIEATLEKGFSKHFYYMFTGSLFNATYKGSNGVTRNTDFNGKFATNGLFGYEFTINKRQTINVGTKVTLAGGRWYGDIDTLASAANKEVIYKDNDDFNSYQFRPYFRADLKLNYKINARKVTHEIGIDIVNLFDTKNILRFSWVPLASDNTKGVAKEEFQLGRLPIFYYRIDF